MSTAYNLSEYYIDEPRISGFIVVFVPYGLPPSDLFIHRFFFLQFGSICCGSGGRVDTNARWMCNVRNEWTSYIDRNNPKMWFVMLRPQFFFFICDERMRENIIFFLFVRLRSASLSSFLMYCTFAIINNLLFSLQNKFPFVFFPFLWIYVNGSTHWYSACRAGHVTNITLLQQ